MRQPNLACPAVDENDRTQADDNLNDVTCVSTAGQPGTGATRLYP